MALAAQVDVIDRIEARRRLESCRRRAIDDLRYRIARIRAPGSGAAPAPDPDGNGGPDRDLSVLETLATTLQRIEVAIARIDRGEYEWCTRCHKRITADRLRAIPFALRCQQCETACERETAEASLRRQRQWKDALAMTSTDDA